MGWGDDCEVWLYDIPPEKLPEVLAEEKIRFVKRAGDGDYQMCDGDHYDKVIIEDGEVLVVLENYMRRSG